MRWRCDGVWLWLWLWLICAVEEVRRRSKEEVLCLCLSCAGQDAGCGYRYEKIFRVGLPWLWNNLLLLYSFGEFIFAGPTSSCFDVPSCLAKFVLFAFNVCSPVQVRPRREVSKLYFLHDCNFTFNLTGQFVGALHLPAAMPLRNRRCGLRPVIAHNQLSNGFTSSLWITSRCASDQIVSTP